MYKFSGAKHGESYNETQERLDEFKTPIILKGEKPKDLADLIYRIIMLGECSYYSNGKEQCDYMRRRSAEDIYRIAKNYFKDVTYATVKLIMNKLYVKRVVNMCNCSTTRKQVYCPTTLISQAESIRAKINE